MKKVLVVEDSVMVTKVLKHVFASSELFEPLYASDFAQAKALFNEHGCEIFAALVDLSLPDAPNGEVVDYSLEQGLPTIVLTASFCEEKRKALLAKGIVDYVIKEGRYSYQYALGVLTRLMKNQHIKVLVVDDSDTARKHICNLLTIHLYQVIAVNDGIQAIRAVLENPDLKLLITDYNMPRMNGCELVKNIRLKYEKSDLVIIGLSAEGEGALSARFIKSGANDFLNKPFNQEEFYCRVSHNVEFIELIESIRDSTKRDDLTGAYNRKYFYEVGERVLFEAKKKKTPLSAAIIEIEGMAPLVSEFGYEVGDEVVRTIASEFNSLFERFTYARIDGYEFCVLMPGLNLVKAVAFIERVKEIVNNMTVETFEHRLSISFSAGVSSIAAGNFDELMSAAAGYLRRAQDAGGSLVFYDD